MLIFPVSVRNNAVALAFNGLRISLNWNALQARAEALQFAFGLPTADRDESLRRVSPHQQGGVLSI